MVVDYQSMSARELQQACRDRGLPTARDKDTMVARLTEADIAPATPGIEQAPEAPSTEQAPRAPVVWQERYPVRAGGLTDAEHTANRAAVAAAARALGYTPIGDGYRTGTVDGMHVYEVHLRRGPR